MEPAFPDDDSVPLDDRRYVPAKTLCEQYGVGEKYIARLVIESKIDGKFLNGDWYIRYDSLDRYFGDQLEALWCREGRAPSDQEASLTSRDDRRNHAALFSAMKIHDAAPRSGRADLSLHASAARPRDVASVERFALTTCAPSAYSH